MTSSACWSRSYCLELGADSFIEAELSGPRNGPWRRLFLDSAVIEQSSMVEKVFHSATKYEANPILVADRPWEGKSAIIGPYVYGTVFHESGRFRLWYQLLYQGNHVGYAESDDGIHWRKPDLSYTQFESKPTNLLVSVFQPESEGKGICHNPSVILRPNEVDPQKRFALYGFDSSVGHPRVAFSPDGLKWTYPEESRRKPLFSSSDVVNFFYDPYQDAYFCTWKTRNRRGRAVGIAKSKDGIDWNKVLENPVFSADDLDPDDMQIYGMPVFPYQGLYMGQPWMYRARYFRYGDYSVNKLHESQSDSPRTIEPQMTWSWDLIQWTRPPNRQPLIRLGERNQWDGGMIITARAPIIVGNELWFYYGGTDKVHDEKQVKASIGLARMRLDGFCSLRSVPNSSGWFITKREPMLSPRIRINAKTGKEGRIDAELLDRNNKVIPGFARKECTPFRGDSVSHELAWNHREFPERSKYPDVKIRFYLEDAEIFSYLPLALDPAQSDIARFQTTGP